MSKEHVDRGCQITCATNLELVKLYARPTYTDYYKSLILAEMRDRGMVGKY